MPLKVSSGKKIPSSLPPPGSIDLILAIPYRQQNMTNWCWAACCEMVFIHYGINNVTQEQIVSFELGDQCPLDQNPLPSSCNQARWPDRSYSNWNIKYDRVQRALSKDELQDQLDVGQPIEPYFLWNSGNSHVAIVRGYYSNGDVEVHDPWFETSRCSYEYVLSAYDLGDWVLTYTNITSN